MEERRRMRRFMLQLPCLIYAHHDRRGDLLCSARTIDIGSGGALVESDTALSTELPIQFELLVKGSDHCKPDRDGCCISLAGRVARVQGVRAALAFGEEYQIVRLSRMIGLCGARSRWLESIGSAETGALNGRIAETIKV